MEKNNTLSIIALIAIVAVVGIVVAFAVVSKGNTRTAPVYFSADSSSQATNAAGMARAAQCDVEGNWCGPCGEDGSRYECIMGSGCYRAHRAC